MTEINARHNLRLEMRAARARLTPAMRMQAALELARQLELFPEFQNAKNVGVYWAVGGELPLLHVVNRLVDRGQGIFLPVIESNGTLQFSPWRQGIEMQVNRFGIPEPQVLKESSLRSAADLDLVLLPLLAFDRKGNRLGSGGGYYDKSFEFINSPSYSSPKPLLLGVGYSLQEVDFLSPAAWDVALDAIVTEREFIPVSLKCS